MPLRKANQMGLDLVEIAPTAQPSGLSDRRFRQVPLRVGQAGKGTQNIALPGSKEVKFRVNIDAHDYT